MTEPRTTRSTAQPTATPTKDEDRTTNSLEQVIRTLTQPLATLTRAVPAGPVPVALGAGALAVAGVIEWPIAAAVGLGYLALRRWR